MSTTQENQKGIYLLLLLVPFFWGAAFGLAQHVITEIPPFLAATLRFGLAGIVLLVLVAVKKEWDTKSVKQHWLGLLLMALTGIFGYNALFFTALLHTSAINGSLIMATSPVFITLGAVLFLKEEWNKRLAIGLILSLFGVMIVILNGSLETLLSLSFNFGDLLFLGGLACWVLHGLIGKTVMKDVSPILTTTITTLVGSFPLLVLSFNEGGWGSLSGMSLQSIGEMVFMIIFSSVIAFILWNTGIKKIGASKAGIYMNLVPINATLIAVFLYDATMTWQQFVGMTIVIVGVYFTTGHSRSHTRLVRKRESKQAF